HRCEPGSAQRVVHYSREPLRVRAGAGVCGGGARVPAVRPHGLVRALAIFCSALGARVALGAGTTRLRAAAGVRRDHLVAAGVGAPLLCVAPVRCGRVRRVRGGLFSGSDHGRPGGVGRVCGNSPGERTAEAKRDTGDRPPGGTIGAHPGRSRIPPLRPAAGDRSRVHHRSVYGAIPGQLARILGMSWSDLAAFRGVARLGVAAAVAGLATALVRQILVGHTPGVTALAVLGIGAGTFAVLYAAAALALSVLTPQEQEAI